MASIENDLVAIAEQRWNEAADKYNQWSELEAEEKDALIQAVRLEQPTDVPQSPTHSD